MTTYETALHVQHPPLETRRTRGRLYIAGPMRGYPGYNFPAFAAAATVLREYGYEVVSPAEMDQNIYGWGADGPTDEEFEQSGFDLNEALERDFDAIRKCDAIVLLHGWQASEGVQQEIVCARQAGRTVYEYRRADSTPCGFWLKSLRDNEISAPSNQASDGERPLAAVAEMRSFGTGATRNVDVDKYDYEGFLSPLVLREFGRYMHTHRLQADGTLRASDNWQKGIPADVYMKSQWRHFHDLWMLHRGYTVFSADTDEPVTIVDAICAQLFNLQGYLLEHLKAQEQAAA